MKVIVAGYSKTGTKSMTAALELLGFTVYDALEHANYHYAEWQKILTTGGTTDDFQNMYRDVDAVVDAPSFYFWKEIHEAFPEAKIILTLRDEEAWLKSTRNQIKKINENYFFKVLQSFTPSGFAFFRHSSRFLHLVYGTRVLTPWTHIHYNETVLRKIYRQHTADVTKNAPPNQLLLYNIEDGWSSLCPFLEVPIPDRPFPRKNVGGKVLDMYMRENAFMKQILNEGKIVGLVLLASVAVTAIAVMFRNRRPVPPPPQNVVWRWLGY